MTIEDASLVFVGIFLFEIFAFKLCDFVTL
jgi:hypothetical protein